MADKLHQLYRCQRQKLIDEACRHWERHLPLRLERLQRCGQLEQALQDALTDAIWAR